MFPDYNEDSNVVCPFHDDTSPSLHISSDGKAKCHSGQCGMKASSIIELWSKFYNIPYLDARNELYGYIEDVIPDSRVKAFERNLAHALMARDWLRGNTRGLYDIVMKDFRLGYDPKTERITIPIFDQFGMCVNIRSVDWRGRSENKVINVRGKGKPRLFPEKTVVDKDVLLLVEGEWDAIMGQQLGFPTVTWTGGAGSYSKDFLYMFEGKTVAIIYDNDQAGHLGAAEMLSLIDGSIIGNLGFQRGKDLTEWVQIYGADNVKRELAGLELNLKMHKIKRSFASRKKCPCCEGKGWVYE
jgi:DNA primase